MTECARSLLYICAEGKKFRALGILRKFAGIFGGRAARALLFDDSRVMHCAINILRDNCAHARAPRFIAEGLFFRRRFSRRAVRNKV